MDAVLFIGLFVFLVLFLVTVAYLIYTAIAGGVASRPRSATGEYDLRSDAVDGLKAVKPRVSPVIERARHKLVWEDDTILCFARHYRHAWAWVLAILFAPIGLLLLFVIKKYDNLVFQTVSDDEGSRLRIEVKLSRAHLEKVRGALAELGEPRAAAGWYQSEPGVERYWDGEAWTDETRQAAAEPIVVGPRMKKG